MHSVMISILQKYIVICKYPRNKRCSNDVVICILANKCKTLFISSSIHLSWVFIKNVNFTVLSSGLHYNMILWNNWLDARLDFGIYPQWLRIPDKGYSRNAQKTNEVPFLFSHASFNNAMKTQNSNLVRRHCIIERCIRK